MMARTTPLLSIIIPTHRRPQYLPRAIDSALQSAPDRDVEVIVVPNGPDDSWKATAKFFLNEPRVQWHPIQTAHACTARNRGLVLAKGRYVRFLDDDDYLLDGSKLQIEEMEKGGYEICSGKIINVDMDGTQLGVLASPTTNDFVVATTLVSGLPLPVGNVFLRKSVANFRWNEEVKRTQDNVWMYTLASGKEWEWTQSNQIVGAWFQHNQDRISTALISRDFYPDAVPALESLWIHLKESDRLTDERARAIAEALWWHIHARFQYQPIYWHKIAKLAQSIDVSARPKHPIFESRSTNWVSPILFEWLLYPARFTASYYRYYKNKHSRKNYIRNI
jgi:glycosyltransferase involved in cell wall biosynthesis